MALFNLVEDRGFNGSIERRLICYGMNFVYSLNYQSERRQAVELKGRLARVPSLPVMKWFSTILLACVLAGSSGPANSSPLGQGTAGIGGRVSPCVRLSLGQAPLGQAWQQQAAGTGLVVTANSVGIDAVQVVLSGTAPSPALQVALPLEIRTNVAYELKLVLLSSEGCAPEIATSVGSIRPSGTLVSSGAAGASRISESLDLARCFSPTAALRGSRVSARGNFSTIANALLTNLDLSISPNQQQCYWRVVFRISLHPSA